MKTFIVLLVGLSAVSLVFSRSWKESTSGNDDELQQKDLQQKDWQETELTRERLREQDQDSQRLSWRNENRQRTSSNSMTDSEDPLEKEWTDMIPFRTKITQRIENSEPLNDQPKTKEKLMKFLEDKVKVCKHPSGGKNVVNKQCMGRLTGQMMQMIAAFEKGTEDMTDSYEL